MYCIWLVQKLRTTAKDEDSCWPRQSYTYINGENALPDAGSVMILSQQVRMH